MTEVDYQLALLLQNKLEQENKDSRLAKMLQQQFETENESNKRSQSNATDLSDSLIARSLQEQFQRELEVERPGQNLIYEPGSSTRNPIQTTKSLTDPSWEVIDPTPDIHTLFMAFNERFFWNQLGSVTVSWSKRMTTCAGICSYQGRGGMCSITLSEPLLKLRPRKDLVETLLHEMIHAYLFVSNNNRDRDGHGPEFHRHMRRINDEAGTSITVYHNFHDEVDLYKQHWWRCNGPCQSRKPYFGVVRRAMNRAPGPNDLWWAEHTRTCGGQYAKIKEPEKQVKPTKSKPPAALTSKSPDIRTFFPTENMNKPTSNNIKTINSNNPSTSKINKVISNSTNIFGFKNLDNNETSDDEASKKNKSIMKPTKINKNPKSGNKLGSINSDKNSSPDNKLGSKNSVTNKDYSAVRNHWVNKFSNGTNSESSSKSKEPKKRVSSDLPSTSAEKVPRLSERLADCPVCSKQVPESEINTHLDECLNKGESKYCYMCGVSVPVEDFQKHLRGCMENSFNDDVFSPVKKVDASDDLEMISDAETKYDECLNKGESKDCYICRVSVPVKDFQKHLNGCMENSFNDDVFSPVKKIDTSDDPDIISDTETKDDDSDSDRKKKKCDICKKNVSEENFDVHVSDCLHNMFDRIEQGLDKDNHQRKPSTSKNVKEKLADSEIHVKCLACNKKILKSALNAHLEDCMVNIFSDENDPAQDENEENGLYNCPCCTKLFKEGEMNDHIDVCLNIADDSY